jgi:ABC-type glucose/galactose transport system permease subunit
MHSIVAAYGILIVYFALSEGRRKGEAAKTFSAGQFDKGTTRLVSVAVVFNIAVLIAATVLNYFQMGNVIDVIGWTGVAVMVGGIALRAWATTRLVDSTPARCL